MAPRSAVPDFDLPLPSLVHSSTPPAASRADPSHLAPEDAFHSASPPRRLPAYDDAHGSGSEHQLPPRRSRRSDGPDNRSPSRRRRRTWKKLLWVKQSCTLPTLRLAI